MRQSKTMFLKCECGDEVLAIEKFKDKDDFSWPIIGLYLYKNWADSFWVRLKWCWKYLRYGEYYGASIEIQKEDLPRIIEFMKSASEEVK